MDGRCPCKKDCPDRSGDCHAKCSKYLEWKAEHEKELEERRNKNLYPSSHRSWVKTADGYWRNKKN